MSTPQKDELDDIPIELSKVQSVKVRSYSVVPKKPAAKTIYYKYYYTLRVNGEGFGFWAENWTLLSPPYQIDMVNTEKSFFEV